LPQIVNAAKSSSITTTTATIDLFTQATPDNLLTAMVSAGPNACYAPEGHYAADSIDVMLWA
jgi:hypothetical protein